MSRFLDLINGKPASAAPVSPPVEKKVESKKVITSPTVSVKSVEK